MSNKTPDKEEDQDNVKRLLPQSSWDAVKKAKAALAEIQRIFKENENKINNHE